MVFVAAAKVINENPLAPVIRNLTRPKLQIFAQVGHLALESPEASLLIQAVSESRQARSPNTSTKDCRAVARSSTAILLHRSTAINIRGESYRLKDNND
ncbi:MAG: hypothetical protein IPK58_21050 [Acidobacteria bacterium]|nr:hypothetical protein [Acidobacteriota bacterium]